MKKSLTLIMSWMMIATAVFGFLMSTAPNVSAVLNTGDVIVTQDATEKQADSGESIIFGFTFNNNNAGGDTAYIWFNVSNPQRPTHPWDSYDWNCTIASKITTSFVLGSGAQSTRQVEVRARDIVNLPANTTNLTKIFYLDVNIYRDSSYNDLVDSSTYFVKTTIKPQRGVDMEFIGASKKMTNPGGSCSFSINATNTGNAPDRIDFTVTDFPAGWTVFVNPSQTGDLDQGEYQSFTLYVQNIPSDARNMSYSITVKGASNADPTTYTTIVATVWVSATYGIELTTPTPSVDAAPGDQVHFVVNVSNIGNTDYEVVLLNLEQPGHGADAWTNVTPAQTTLNGWSATNHIDVFVTVPDDAASEVRLFYLNATRQGGAYYAPPLALTIGVGEYRGAQLTLSQSNSSDTVQVYSGGQAKFWLECTNIGNKVDTFIVETSQLPEGWTKSVKNLLTDVNYVAGSNTEAFPLTITTKAFSLTQLPKDQSKYYTVNVTVYPEGEPTKGDTVTLNIYLKPQYNMTLKDVGGNQTIVDPGNQGTLNFKLTNYGNVNDSYELNIDMIGHPASFTGTFADTFSLEGGSPPSSLDVTYNKYVEFSVNMTNNRKKVVPGTYKFNLSISSNGDPSKIVWEHFLYTVTEKYDASLGIVGSDTQVVKPMNMASFRIKVTNVGSTQETAQLSFGAYDVNLTDSAVFNQSEIVLLPDEYQEVWVNITPESGVIGGTVINMPVKVKVKEDTDDIIFDTTTLYVQVDTGYEVNISVPMPSVTTKAGQTLHFNTILRNDGNLNDRLYLSPTMSDFPNDDWQVNYNVSGAVGNVLTTPILAPKQKFFVDVMVIVPANAPAAPAFNVSLIVTSENDGTVMDSKELDIRVTDTYAVGYKSVVTEKTVEPGIGATYDVKVWNSGTVSDSYNLEIMGVIPNYMTAHLSSYSLTNISPGDVVTLTLYVNISIDEDYTYDPSVVLTVKTTSVARPSTVYAQAMYTVNIAERPIGVEFGFMDDRNNVDPSSYTDFTVKLKNTGKLWETFDLEIVGNKPAYVTVTFLDSNGTTINYLRIASKTTVAFTMRVAVDGSIQYTLPSTLNLTLRASSWNFSMLYAEHVFTLDINPRRGVKLESTMTDKECTAGETVTYTISLENTGDDTDSFSIAVEDNLPYSTWAQLSTKTIYNVASNGMSQFTLSIDIPEDRDPEIFVLTVNVTVKDNPEFFDTIELTTTINPIYGVSIKTPDSTKTGNIGDTVNFIVQVENDGTVNDTFDLLFNEDLYQDWSISLSNQSVSVAKNSVSSDITLSVEIPLDARAKDYNLVVKATSRGNDSVFAEKTFKLTVKQTYSFTVTALDSENLDNIKPGDSADIQYEIKNTGNDNDTISISGSSTYSSWVSPQQASVTLGPGEKAKVTVRINVPSNKDDLPTSSVAHLTVTFSSEGNIPDVDKTVTVSISGEAAAKLESSYTSMDGYAGDYVNFTVRLTNEGTATDDFLVTFSGSWSTYADKVELVYSPSVGAKQQGQQITVYNLAPGETEYYTLSVKVKENQEASTYQINTKATPDNSPNKNDELSLTINLKQTYKVDMYVTIPSEAKKSAEPGQQVTFEVYVKNAGNGIQNIVLSYMPVSSAIDSTWTFSDYSSSTATVVDNKVMSLAAGSEAKVSITVTIPAGTDAGDYQLNLIAKADISNPSAAMNEIATLGVVIEVKPVYGVSMALSDGKNTETVVPTEGTVATTTVTREYEVKNDGNSMDTFQMKLKSLPTGWTGVADPETFSLAPGNSKVVSVTITIPPISNNPSLSGLNNEFVVSKAYKITVQAQSTNSSSASATSDLTVTVSDYHKIVLSTSQNTGLKVPYGDKLTVTMTATNEGNLDDIVSLKASSVKGDVTVKLSSSTLTLQRGKTADFTVEITPKSSAVSGSSFSFLVEMTYSDSTKDTYSLSGSIEMAHISIQSMTMDPSSPKVGDTVTVTVVLENTGTLNATDVNVKLLVDDEVMDSANVDLKTEETRDVTLSWVAADGQKNVRVEVSGNMMSSTVEKKGSVDVTKSSWADTVPGGWSTLFLVILVFIVFVIALILVLKPKDNAPQELEKELELAEKRVKETEMEKTEKPVKKELKKKPKAAPKSKPVHIQCPKCNSVMEVTTTKRPVKVRCKECGSILLLKE